MFSHKVCFVSDELKEILSKIKIKFSFRDKLYIDFVDHFPNFKNGLYTTNIIHDLLFSYILVLKQNNKSDELLLNCGIDHDITVDNYENVVNKIKNMVENNTTLSDELITPELEHETKLSKHLVCIIRYYYFKLKVCQHKSSFEDGDLLNLLRLINYDDPPWCEELLSDPDISLLLYIVRVDSISVTSALLIEDVNPWIGYNDIYYFAEICYKTYFQEMDLGGLDLFRKFIFRSIEDKETIILKLIKESAIKRYMLEKHVIKNIFDNVSDDIFQHIIIFR